VNFPRTRALLEASVAGRQTPAAVIEVGSPDAATWTAAFGTLSYDADAAPAVTGTIFDLASLTKVIATTSLVMRLVAEGRLGLDTPLAAIWPAWDGPQGAITVAQLLDHSSGLPAHARLWEQHRDRAGFADAIRAMPLERPPGERSVYSDLGFILLGWLVEDIGARPLDDAFHALADAWGLGLGFRPGEALMPGIAPTEFDPWRGRLLRGDVHDENAAALGGVAGHAGLFGTAAGVGAFARLVLRSFTEPTPLGDPSLMRTFATPADPRRGSRALGWDPMRPTSSCGTRASAASIGHTGFTGTSLWIDPVARRYVVLLSNRVNPTRANDAFIALRPRVHDAVAEDLGA
jgi:CubicO group peptidase (beta-lactamase class C family)